MPRASRQKPYRETMFRKAWKLDLAGDVDRYNDRLLLQDRLCNAIAYYLVLNSKVDADRLHILQTQWRDRVSTSINIGAQHGRRLDQISDADLLKTCEETIETRTQRAIIAHFEHEQDRKVVGIPLAIGRRDPNSAGLAFQISVRLAAEGLFRIFNQKPSNHEFHAELVRSEALGLVFKNRHRVTNKSA